MRTDEVSERAIFFAREMARRLFAARERKGTRNVEIHINEATLAGALAIAWQHGRDDKETI